MTTIDQMKADRDTLRRAAAVLRMYAGVYTLPIMPELTQETMYRAARVAELLQYKLAKEVRVDE